MGTIVSRNKKWNYSFRFRFGNDLKSLFLLGWPDLWWQVLLNYPLAAAYFTGNGISHSCMLAGFGFA